MTDKKQRILDSALKLFAQEGYSAVSTNRIAQDASVSEGLIFKHFDNKEGLLLALKEKAELRIHEIYAYLSEKKNPIHVIESFIDIPFTIDPSEYDFWRLQFMLKWDNRYYMPDKMDNIKNLLTESFHELNYEFPREEAEALDHMIESISIGILRDGMDRHKKQRNFLKKKYKISIASI